MMGGFAAPAAMLASNIAPALIAARQPDPTGAMTGPVMGAGQAQRPQGMSTAAQTGMSEQDRLLQLLMGLMASLSQQQWPQGQGQATPVQQPGIGPPPQTAGGITPGPSRTGVY